MQKSCIYESARSVGPLPGAAIGDDYKTPLSVAAFTISRTYINLAYSPIQSGGHSAFDMF